MKSLLVLAVLCALAFPSFVRAADDSVDDRYVEIYGLMLTADSQVEKGRPAAAQTNYAAAYTKLIQLQKEFPTFQTNAVNFRLDYLKSRLAAPGATPRTGAASGAAMLPAEPAALTPLNAKWTLGKRYLQRMTMTQVSDINASGAGGGNMKQTMNQSQDIAIAVTREREGGGRELDMEIVNLTMDMKMGDTTLMTFDSRKPAQADPTNSGIAALRKLTGTHVKMLTDARGKTESVQGLQEVLDAFAAGSAAEKAMMKDLLSEDNLKQMSSAGQGLPDKPVKIGDSWPLKVETVMGAMGIAVNSTYAFKGWQMHADHKCAVLEHTGDIAINLPNGSPMTGMITIDQGKSTGTLWFDPELGMAIESADHQDLAMKVKVGDQSLATQTRQDINTKLVGVTDLAK